MFLEKRAPPAFARCPSGYADGKRIAWPEAMTTLIVYGRVPSMSTFHASITDKNRKSFEKRLLPELEKLGLLTFSPATLTPICHAKDLGALLRGRPYSSVVFYGHAFTFTLETRSGKKSEMRLQTVCGGYITATEFADAIRGTSVRTVLIAGCESNGFAADLSTRVEKVKFGGLMSRRFDEIGGDARAINHFRIIPQPVKWWGK
jgi:hypothetical protein